MAQHSTKTLQSGRPKGSTRFDPISSRAFGLAVRQLRLEKEISQEMLASIASVDRSFMGRIERGETTPTLTLMLKIARALEVSGTTLMEQTEYFLGEQEVSEDLEAD